MFSGIILERAKVEEVKNDGVGRKFWLNVPMAFHRRIKKGASVALNGACFTVLQKSLRAFEVEAMPQTLRLTTAGDWVEGDLLNFEPSLRVGDELGGHFVFGHVDEVCQVDRCLFEGTSTVMCVRASQGAMAMIAPRGSIAIDGVSLTVVSCKETSFRVSLLPETLRATTLGKLKSGSKVNLEIDMLARYAYEFLHKN
ncbi:riboflavin synthase subunit alpha [Candidatus Uhrbacteria bacterium RIFCSPHIGHO2_02_FULL_54_11]|nr:MAG: riboflavin synthase subunit alpha [Candidatus Uhrbacteria bacterium RIFCSPHIGHO2_02_FULL_54_11]